jgi:hypothetical protein
MPRAHRSCLVAALALVAVLAPAQVEACKCAHPKTTPRVAIEQADLVVEAQVDSHVFTAEQGFVTELAVSRIHKGTTSKRLVLTASKTCAAAFEAGGSYLVYAWADGSGGFSTTYCSRTALLADAAADLRELGRRGPSTSSSTASSRESGIAGIVATFAATWRDASPWIDGGSAALAAALERTLRRLGLCVTGDRDRPGLHRCR